MNSLFPLLRGGEVKSMNRSSCSPHARLGSVSCSPLVVPLARLAKNSSWEMPCSGTTLQQDPVQWDCFSESNHPSAPLLYVWWFAVSSHGGLIAQKALALREMQQSSRMPRVSDFVWIVRGRSRPVRGRPAGGCCFGGGLSVTDFKFAGLAASSRSAFPLSGPSRCPYPPSQNSSCAHPRCSPHWPPTTELECIPILKGCNRDSEIGASNCWWVCSPHSENSRNPKWSRRCSFQFGSCILSKNLPNPLALC